MKPLTYHVQFNFLDKLASDNKFLVPILDTIDNLEPVSTADPNFYIIKSVSKEQSSILAYTSKSGLWNFDAYSYVNQKTLVVEACTATSIQFDISNMTDEELESLSLNYYG